MTFETFINEWCDQLPGADGDHASVVADIFLRKAGRVSDPITQRTVIDHEMRGTLYFDKGYAGNCSLRLRPYARA